MYNAKLVHPLGDVETINQKYKSNEVKIEVTEIGNFVTLFAKTGKEAELATKLKITAKPSCASQAGSFTAIPLSPGQWALISNDSDQSGFVAELNEKIEGLGYISEQSDSRVRFVISGSKARDLMSRGCRLDLHPSVTSKGFCAQTIMAQVGVLIHQVGDTPIFELYVYSGFARSFWHWLDQTAAQFEAP